MEHLLIQEKLPLAVIRLWFFADLEQSKRSYRSLGLSPFVSRKQLSKSKAVLRTYVKTNHTRTFIAITVGYVLERVSTWHLSLKGFRVWGWKKAAGSILKISTFVTINYIRRAKNINIKTTRAVSRGA